MLLKHHFSRKKCQSKEKLDKYYRNSRYHFQWRKNGLKEYALVVQECPTPNFLDNKLRSLHQKHLKNSRYDVAQSEIESGQGHRSPMHITYLRGFDIEWPVWYEKTIRKVGTVFAQNWPKTSKEDLALFNRNPYKILSHIKTMKWNIETKRWVSPKELVKVGLSSNKVMVTGIQMHRVKSTVVLSK